MELFLVIFGSLLAILEAGHYQYLEHVQFHAQDQLKGAS